MITSSYIYDFIIRVHDNNILSNSFNLEKKYFKSILVDDLSHNCV